MDKIFTNVIEATVLPKIINIYDNLYSANFFLMKLLPAKFILEQAISSGKINYDTVVIESTSGTFGLALAILCNQFNIKLILVSDPAIDENLNNRLTELGAKVHICEKPAKVGGYQRARLDKVDYYRKKHINHFFPGQYSNRMNPAAYAMFAEQLISTFGQVDILVGSVGSGGSMSGTLKYLRMINSNTYGIAVDSNTSMLFGLQDAGANRLVRGLGNSLMPENLEHSLFDEIHWLNDSEIAHSTRKLHKNHSLFCGPTSGATYKVAEFIANKNPGKNVVFICADEGYRYAETVYNDIWMKDLMANPEHLTSNPKEVFSLLDNTENWSYLKWNRRDLNEVINIPSTEVKI